MNEECRRYQESVSELSMPEDVIQHGESCEECRRFSGCQEQLRKALPSWKTPEFSPDFTLSVMSRLAEENIRRRSMADSLRELLQIRFSISLPIGALASVLLVVSLALNVAFWPGNQDRDRFGNRSGSIPLAGNRMAIGFTQNTIPDPNPTPRILPLIQDTGEETTGGSLIVPREFLSAGAFLLVPIIEPYVWPNVNQQEPHPLPDNHRGI